MLQTTNYQLNQWESTDRILRTDFNRDNAALDAALAKKLELIPIREVVPSASANAIELDVSDIDFSQWRAVIMETALVGNKYDILIRPNGGTTGTYYNIKGTSQGTGSLGAVTSTADGSLPTGQAIFLPLYCPARKVTGFILQNTNFYCSSDTEVTFQDLTSLTLVPWASSGTLDSGGKIAFLGVK